MAAVPGSPSQPPGSAQPRWGRFAAKLPHPGHVFYRHRAGSSIPEQTRTHKRGEGSADGENIHGVIPGSCCSWQGGLREIQPSLTVAAEKPHLHHMSWTLGTESGTTTTATFIPGAPPALTLAGKARWEQGWTITAASLMDFSSSISRSRCCIHHVLRNQQLCSKPSCSESSSANTAPAGTIPQPDTILPGDTARGTARGSDSSAEPCP